MPFKVDATSGWLSHLDFLLKHGQKVSPRESQTVELLACKTITDMTRPVVTVMERRLGYRFMPAEAWWILSGSNRVEDIAPYSKMISNFSDDGVTFRGAYGPPIVDQLGWCAEQLLKDPLTRQAVLTIWRPRPGPSRDIPCTISMQFFLRPDPNVESESYQLHTVTTMRSSDIWLGWPYDVFNFSMVSGYLAALIMHLRPGFGVELGALHMNMGSSHMYERHWDQARNIVELSSSPAKYEYDDYDHYVDRLTTWRHEPFNPGLYWQRPHDLVDHLKALADRDRDGLKGPWLTELLSEDDA